jgi:transcriptional regulator with XRE-family HTH domain
MAQPPGDSLSSLGGRLRSARHDAGLTMRQLATDVGVSQPFLSQVETDKARPSVATLTLLAQRLGISVDTLVSWEPLRREIAISRASDPGVLHLTEMPNATVRWLARDAPNVEMIEIRSTETRRAWRSMPRSHAGTEVIYIVGGKLTVEIDGHEPKTLHAGDSACFDSGRMHCWQYDGHDPVTLVCTMISHSR